VSLHVPTVEEFDALVDRVTDLETRLAATAPEPSPYMTVVEAASYLRCSRQRVYDLLSAGRLERRKDGARTLVSRAEIERYLEAE